MLPGLVMLIGGEAGQFEFTHTVKLVLEATVPAAETATGWLVVRQVWLLSVSDTVRMPGVLKVTGKVPWPLVSVESAGKTASGEPYDMNKLTAAHRTLPFNSRIKVTNLRNGKEVTVRVNDRGPNVPGRLLDLSKAAAQRLGFIGSGRAPVRVTVVRYPKGYVAQPSPFLLASCVRYTK